MNTITPQSSFALLLATSVWEELHMLIEVCFFRSGLCSANTFHKDYVVDKWEEVSVSEEFEQCCQEVAAGEYVSFFLLLRCNISQQVVCCFLGGAQREERR